MPAPCVVLLIFALLMSVVVAGAWLISRALVGGERRPRRNPYRLPTSTQRVPMPPVKQPGSALILAARDGVMQGAARQEAKAEKKPWAVSRQPAAQPAPADHSCSGGMLNGMLIGQAMSSPEPAHHQPPADPAPHHTDPGGASHSADSGGHHHSCGTSHSCSSPSSCGGSSGCGGASGCGS